MNTHITETCNTTKQHFRELQDEEFIELTDHMTSEDNAKGSGICPIPHWSSIPGLKYHRIRQALRILRPIP
jgi:predicted transcriptional regulator